MDGDITRITRIEDMPGFNEAVDKRVIDILNSGRLGDLISDTLANQAMVGMQAQSTSPLSREQFDKTDTRLSQLIRFTKANSGSATDCVWEICIPGSEGLSDPPAIITQDGTAIEFASGELTRVDQGPWWQIVNLSYPVTTGAITAIYAIVVPDIGGTSSGDWPVSGDHAKVMFKRDGGGTHGITAVPATCAPGITRGLKWQIAGISTSVPSQLVVGDITGVATMGDADVNGISSSQIATAKSIISVGVGVYQLVNINHTPITNDAAIPMVVVKTDTYGNKYTDVMEQGTGGGKGDADETGTGLPAQRSVQALPSHAGVLQVYNFDDGTITTPNDIDTVLMRRASGTGSKPELVYIETTPL